MKFDVASLRNPFADPSRRKAMIWRVVAFVCLAATTFTYFQLDARRKAAETSLKQRQADILAARQSGLEALSAAEIAGLQRAAADFKNGFTPVASVPALLDSLSDEANRNDVIVLSIRSEAPEPVRDQGADMQVNGKKLSRLPIAMSLRGNTRSIASFLRAISESSKRICVVERYRLSKTPPPEVAVQCDLTVSFFSDDAA